MGERQRWWDHSFACAWHDGEACTCKDASDRPLTTGEGQDVPWVPETLDEAVRVWHSATDVCNELGAALRACHDARRAAEKDAGRLREQVNELRSHATELQSLLDALKRQRWSNQNRAEVAERGHKAALARDFEQRDTIKALRAQLAESEAANESYAVEAKMAREQLDAARQALAAALDCKGPYNGTVSERGGYPALCHPCADRARAALGVEGQAG